MENLVKTLWTYHRSHMTLLSKYLSSHFSTHEEENTFRVIYFVILLFITCLHLCNTNNIIFMDNGGWVLSIKLARTFNKVHHSVKPNRFRCCFIHSEWLVDAATKVFLLDFQEKVIPLFEKTKPVGDLGFWGYDIPSITISNRGHILIFLIKINQDYSV